MRSSPYLPNENERLLALREYGLDASQTVPELQPLVELAKTIFELPIVLVSLVEHTSQFFPAKTGLNVCETSREVSFCSHALAQKNVFVVPDALLDPRFIGNPLVTGEPKIRFYAGTQLFAPSGHALGAFCLIDTKPRNGFSDKDQQTLRELASLVSDRLELRRIEHARENSRIRFESIAQTSPNAIICTDAAGLLSFWNHSAQRIFGYNSQEVLGRSIRLLFPEHFDNGPRASHQELSRLLSYPLGPVIELRARHRNGQDFPVEFSLTKWEEQESVSFGAVVRDITKPRDDEDRLFRLAHFDVLTNLPNRTVLRNRINELVEQKSLLAVMIVGLDDFKSWNDTLGHAFGDQVLQHVAVRLSSCLEPHATLARLGGDEFAILLPRLTNPGESAAPVAERVLQAVSQSLAVNERSIYLTASAGIAVWQAEGMGADQLLPNANLALCQAKAEGKNCYRVFTPALRISAQQKRVYEEEIREAYAEAQFELYYQPQVRLSDGALVGAEALLRWNHPQKGLLLPGSFMAFLESGVLAEQVGYWTLQRACFQAALWRRILTSEFRIGVNLFGAQFRTGDLPSRVLAILQQTELCPSALELEITENIILNQQETMVSPLQQLRHEGVGIAFDDYGTGYASLSLLKQYPLSRLKIDRSFVQGMCSSAADASIIRAVLQLGQGFGLAIIAEGIETEEQWARLRKKGCEEGQGYLFGRPMPAAEFESRFSTIGNLQQLDVRLSRQTFPSSKRTLVPVESPGF